MAPRRMTLPDPEPAPPVLGLQDAVLGLRAGRTRTTRHDRVTEAKTSVKAFCLQYLAHHFTDSFCEMHDDIFAICDALGPRPRGVRAARIAPRKFGKTTIISLGLVLYVLAYQLRHFILLIGESATTAEANLATIAQEIETNEALMRDFPHLAPAMDQRGQTTKWTDRQIVCANSATVMAKGMGARMRGVKYRQLRPDLAVIDDPESPETADTFLKRQRHKRWFGGTFMGLGATNWDIVMIGNLPHHDCLIADVVRSPEWDGRLWRAINIPPREEEKYRLGNTRRDGSALWPEVWSLDRLDAYKRQPNVGSLGFVREMMNDPREDENKHFDPATFTYIEFTPDLLLRYGPRIWTFIDPAGGERPGDVRRGKRDWCAIVTVGRTTDGYVDVFDVVLTREMPDKQIHRLLDVYAAFKPREIGVEENMYKHLLAPTIVQTARSRGLYPALKMVTSTSNKVSRILGTQPLINSGVVRFARHLVQKVPEYFVQYDDFPGDFDDGPDATEGAIRLAEAGRHSLGQLVSIGQTSYWRKTS